MECRRQKEEERGLKGKEEKGRRPPPKTD